MTLNLNKTVRPDSCTTISPSPVFMLNYPVALKRIRTLLITLGLTLKWSEPALNDAPVISIPIVWHIFSIFKRLHGMAVNHLKLILEISKNSLKT